MHPSMSLTARPSVRRAVHRGVICIRIVLWVYATLTACRASIVEQFPYLCAFVSPHFFLYRGCCQEFLGMIIDATGCTQPCAACCLCVCGNPCPYMLAVCYLLIVHLRRSLPVHACCVLIADFVCCAPCPYVACCALLLGRLCYAQLRPVHWPRPASICALLCVRPCCAFANLRTLMSCVVAVRLPRPGPLLSFCSPLSVRALHRPAGDDRGWMLPARGDVACPSLHCVPGTADYCFPQGGTCRGHRNTVF